MQMIGTAHATAAGGTTIAWGELGDGPPLVLLHGLYDTHRAWRRTAPFLARHFRVLMPDLPGCGLSGRPDASYSLSWQAQVVADWMQAIGVPRAHLCGHSYGAGVGQWMVLEQRPRIDRLALVDAGGLGTEVAFWLRLTCLPVLGRRLSPTVLRHVMPLVLRLWPDEFGHMEPEERARFLEMSRVPGTDIAFQRTVEGVIDFTGQVMQTAQRSQEVVDMPPTALFWGQDDVIIPVQHGRDAVARAEGMTLTVYPGCGHFPHLDLPERFARDLTAFLLDPERTGVYLDGIPGARPPRPRGSTAASPGGSPALRLEHC